MAVPPGAGGESKRRFTCQTALLLAAALSVGCAGCATGPDYVKPAAPVAAGWQLETPWRQATPADAQDKGAWWQRFGDARLDALEQQALAESPTLQLASARLTQARAQLAGAEAGRYPQLGLAASARRLAISANRPLTSYGSTNSSTVQNDFSLTLNASYEMDFAGRVSRSLEAADASAGQAAADLANTRLLLTADVAATYFNLRSTDVELDVVRRSIALQQRALELVTARHDLGAVSGLDVAQQQALLDNTLTQVELLQKQRVQYEHALATLIGIPAPDFSLVPDLSPINPPAIALGQPSDLLERRPDVAAAERAMAAANAQIGIASAAFYPSVILNAQPGLDSRLLPRLFDAPSQLWSFGISALQTLFDGGRINANIAAAEANYQATVANYRRVVLTAMQEAQDGISGLTALERAADQANAAVTATRRVLAMATARYEGGATAYLDVISAQQAQLNSERQAAQIASQRLQTAVFLVKALGGDWRVQKTED
jgi:NodT family efflux transporter outer membrane factor (OMF) lipoprotein